mmetsp:Transcript_123944/g.239006  ORF Transcript_123944/g.239006 Transcript_123944/m.239006 type:complete len:208 (+) Transcript_123944:1169-1792(+)
MQTGTMFPSSRCQWSCITFLYFCLLLGFRGCNGLLNCASCLRELFLPLLQRVVSGCFQLSVKEALRLHMLSLVSQAAALLTPFRRVGLHSTSQLCNLCCLHIALFLHFLQASRCCLHQLCRSVSGSLYSLPLGATSGPSLFRSLLCPPLCRRASFSQDALQAALCPQRAQEESLLLAYFLLHSLREGHRQWRPRIKHWRLRHLTCCL